MNAKNMNARPTYAISPNPAHCAFIISRHFPPCVTTTFILMCWLLKHSLHSKESRLSLIPHKVSLMGAQSLDSSKHKKCTIPFIHYHSNPETRHLHGYCWPRSRSCQYCWAGVCGQCKRESAQHLGTHRSTVSRSSLRSLRKPHSQIGDCALLKGQGCS